MLWWACLSWPRPHATRSPCSGRRRAHGSELPVSAASACGVLGTALARRRGRGESAGHAGPHVASRSCALRHDGGLEPWPMGDWADPQASQRSLSERIHAYYDETWGDYRWLWLSPRNYAIHFGYWDESTRTHAESLLNMNRALAERIGILPGQHVLDAGCGVGGSALWLARACHVHVTGITLVASQVAPARRFAQAQPHVTFEQQDYAHTTFPDASFDVVWAVESACHAPDKRAFIQEARRLLRPGGRLGMVEYMRVSRPLPSADDEDVLRSWL